VHVVGPRITGDWRARVAQGDERTRLWRIAADYYPGYDTYSARAGGREIPVVVLERTWPKSARRNERFVDSSR
jgi:hypothetical protein